MFDGITQTINIAISNPFAGIKDTITQAVSTAVSNAMSGLGNTIGQAITNGIDNAVHAVAIGLQALVDPFYLIGVAFWNMMLGLIGITAAQTPEMFSQGTWAFVTLDIYPWMTVLGATLLNISFYIGIIRQSNNLKQNFTLEILVESGIKVCIGNALMVSGLSIMGKFFDIASLLSGGIIFETPVVMAQSDTDAGSILFYAFFGMIFCLICIVCSIIIFLTVYGRYLQLYLLVAVSPVALATLPGGPGMSNTAYAWIRTFLSKVFEIVLIILTIVIAAKMCNGISFGQMSGIVGVFDGAVQALQNICTMILLTASVKGMDVFMKRTFAL